MKSAAEARQVRFSIITATLDISRVYLEAKYERASQHTHVFSRRLSAKKRGAQSMPLERETTDLRHKLTEMAGEDEVTICLPGTQLQHLESLSPALP